MPDPTTHGHRENAYQFLRRAAAASDQAQDTVVGDPVGAAMAYALLSIAASHLDLVDQGEAALKQSRRSHKVMKEGWRQNREASELARGDQLKALAVLRENNAKLVQIEQALAEQRARPIPVIGEATIGACGCSTSLPEATDDAPRVAVPEPPKAPEWRVLVKGQRNSVTYEAPTSDEAFPYALQLIAQLASLDPGYDPSRDLARIVALSEREAGSLAVTENVLTPSEFTALWLVRGVFDGSENCVDWPLLRDSAAVWLAYLTGELG